MFELSDTYVAEISAVGDAREQQIAMDHILMRELGTQEDALRKVQITIPRRLSREAQDFAEKTEWDVHRMAVTHVSDGMELEFLA